jgi:hypothetical protein
VVNSLGLITLIIYLMVFSGLCGISIYFTSEQKKQTAMFRLMQKIGSLTQLQYDSRSLLRKIRNVLDNNMDLD